MAPDISMYELCLPAHSKCRRRSTPVHPNRPLLVVCSTKHPVPTMNSTKPSKNENHGALHSGARRGGMRTNPSSDGPADSRELLFQLVQATNLLQLLCNHSHRHKRLRRQRKAATACRRGSHADSQARRGQTKGHHSLQGSPLVPGRAHTGRPRTCPCGVSALATSPREPTSHTMARACKNKKGR